MKVSGRELLGAGALGASVIATGRFRVSDAQVAGGTDRHLEINPVVDRFAERTRCMRLKLSGIDLWRVAVA